MSLDHNIPAFGAFLGLDVLPPAFPGGRSTVVGSRKPGIKPETVFQ